MAAHWEGNRDDGANGRCICAWLLIPHQLMLKAVLTGRCKRNMILDDAEAVWHLLSKDERDVLGYE